MTDKEIIERIDTCANSPDCSSGCPYYERGDSPECMVVVMRNAIGLINRQQKTITNISKLIIDNTYPSFDKDGKPVSIWNADGYKQIEELLKGGADNG